MYLVGVIKKTSGEKCTHKSVKGHLFFISWSNNEALVKYFLRFYFLYSGNID